MKLLIVSSEGMMARKFHSLWSHVLIHFHETFTLVGVRGVWGGGQYIDLLY